MRAPARTLLGIVAALMGADAAAAQQILEIDLGSGRDVIDDEWRAIVPARPYLVDHERGILYATDLEHSDAIMGFSLVTGEEVRLIQIPKGEGPRELPSFRAVAQASDGGLYVLGAGRVLHLDSLGGVVAANWRPAVPGGASGVCDFDGSPAVPSWGGVVRRGQPDDETLGVGIVQGERLAFGGAVEGAMARLKSKPASIFCTSATAYTVSAYEEAADTVFGFSRDGREEAIHPPSEFAGGRRPWNRDLRLAGDGGGNLVLVKGWSAQVAGAVIDPSSGCYSVMRRNDPNPVGRFAGVVADSALVFHLNHEDTVRDGRRTRSVGYTASRVGLHPIRRVSGEPCPGMFPSLISDSDGGSSLRATALVSPLYRRPGRVPTFHERLASEVHQVPRSIPGGARRAQVCKRRGRFRTPGSCLSRADRSRHPPGRSPYLMSTHLLDPNGFGQEYDETRGDVEGDGFVASVCSLTEQIEIGLSPIIDYSITRCNYLARLRHLVCERR